MYPCSSYLISVLCNMKLGRNVARTFLDYYKLVGYISAKPSAVLHPSPTDTLKVMGVEAREDMIIDTQQTHTKAPVSKAILELHPMNLYCLTEEMGEGSTSLYIAGVQLDQRLF
ncbi:hypothetical protein EB796_010688 [Bugula neritina]|uniref:Uncharacterized protein n=1 Tax=Bugula neritina TaxID=10212 RepID=A0A7J7JYK8_BUGNE|nr:hypothetical protein EB796_010688 [Bugula neritina]